MLQAEKARVYIEFCRDCSHHAWCTNHDEQKYRRYFESCRTALMLKCPQVQVLPNQIPLAFRKKFTLGEGSGQPWAGKLSFPRLGSFEVYYGNQIVFSKLSLGKWPNSELVAQKTRQILDNPPSKPPIPSRPIKSTQRFRNKPKKKRVARSMNNSGSTKKRTRSANKHSFKKKIVKKKKQKHIESSDPRAFRDELPQDSNPDLYYDNSERAESENLKPQGKDLFAAPMKKFDEEPFNHFKSSSSSSQRARDVQKYLAQDSSSNEESPFFPPKPPLFDLQNHSQEQKQDSYHDQYSDQYSQQEEQKYDQYSQEDQNSYRYSNEQQSHPEQNEQSSDSQQDQNSHRYSNEQQFYPEQNDQSSDSQQDQNSHRYSNEQQFYPEQNDQSSDSYSQQFAYNEPPNQQKAYSESSSAPNPYQNSENYSESNKSSYSSSPQQEREITKSYNLTLPVSQTVNKKITYINKTDQICEYFLWSTNPKLIVKDPIVTVESQKKGLFKLRFEPVERPQEASYILNVDLQGRPWETIELNITYK